MQKEVSIHLLSRRLEAGGSELFQNVIEDFGDEVDFTDVFDQSTEDDLIEMRIHGTLSDADGRISLQYDETELTGMEGATTTVSYPQNDPTVITMLRYGAVSTALIFEEGKRHICAYETPYMPFEICVHTRTVANHMSMDGGRIDLDYLVEIHGAKAERTLFSLIITPIEQE